MTSEQNKAIVQRFWEAFEADDQNTLAAILSPNLIARTPGVPDFHNRDQHLLGVRMFNAAFSDRHFSIEDLIVEGDRVATRVTMRGVHTGNWQSLSATGKPIEATGLTIEHLQDGRIVERWFSFDVARVVQELGGAAPQ
jgi:steroid delta-isomerase-like uncharacterized protein